MMEITGSQGLQAAQSGLTQATVDVARPTETPSGQAESARPVEQTDSTQSLVSAVESGQQAEAAAEVVEAGSEVLGSIIDISA